MSGNNISDAGVSALTALFAAKNPLKSLKIEANRIGDKGISDVRLFSFLFCFILLNLFF